MDLSSVPPRSSFMPQPPLGHADGGPRFPAAPPPAPRPPYPAALPSRPSSHATLGYPAPCGCRATPRAAPSMATTAGAPWRASPAPVLVLVQHPRARTALPRLASRRPPRAEPAPFPILKVEDDHGYGWRRWEQERREKGEV
ncbi:atherin-like [Panicum virgatum]|uniref:atherin-like n=1 Tax=Panicum virgatum TaxID=38727 RepID=UPI0019D62796|nr:atherin-like [Panicum virgatum]